MPSWRASRRTARSLFQRLVPGAGRRSVDADVVEPRQDQNRSGHAAAIRESRMVRDTAGRLFEVRIRRGEADGMLLPRAPQGWQ